MSPTRDLLLRSGTKRDNEKVSRVKESRFFISFDGFSLISMQLAIVSLTDKSLSFGKIGFLIFLVKLNSFPI